VRGSADQAHCAESAAAHTSGVRKASRAGSQTACLIKAGTLLNICTSITDARVIASAKVETLCAGFTAGPED
jgi:hypothetical protein